MNLSLREQEAWSLSLGHDSVVTTSGYGPLSLDEQADVMAAISPASEGDDEVTALAELGQSCTAAAGPIPDLNIGVKAAACGAY